MLRRAVSGRRAQSVAFQYPFYDLRMHQVLEGDAHRGVVTGDGDIDRPCHALKVGEISTAKETCR